jgi:hypothetical protein
MLIADGSITSGLVSGRAELSDGGFEVDENSYDDMIPVPLEKRGVVHGKLEFVNGLVVEFTGCGLSTRLDIDGNEILLRDDTLGPADEGTIRANKPA